MREAIPLTRRCSGLASLALNSISFGDSLGMQGAEQGTIGVSARTNILLPFRAGPRQRRFRRRRARLSQRFPRTASPNPLNSSSLQAYRPAMSRLINELWPSAQLQGPRVRPATGRSKECETAS